MIKISTILLLTIFCCNVFAQDVNDAEWKNKFLVEFIAKYGTALEYCVNLREKRHELDKESLKILSTLPYDQLRKYITYKHELSMSRCIEDNGGYPVIFLIHYIGNEKMSRRIKEPTIENEMVSRINEELINVLTGLISSPSVLASVNFDKNMSDEKKKELRSITYLDTPFNLVKVVEQIREFQSQSTNGKTTDSSTPSEPATTYLPTSNTTTSTATP
jgi:hypothetical protein